jgi:hypothetical protein
MDLSNIVVCSFHTSDEYYRGHAASLRKNLERLGVAYELEEIEKAPGEEWPDICRKKIGFLARVCDENPDKKVFWIDVDCALLELPTYVAGFTADIIGFQRGFGSPMRIGYAHRTRFWEPCFFGINTTPSARKFIHDAHLLEQSAQIRATDDYFFEESWRSNASRLSFQVIPSIAVISKAPATPQGVSTFFSFGASGNVQAYKHKVKQHGRTGGTARMRPVGGARHQALRAAKLLERRLPASAATSLRKLADTVGLTHVLTRGGMDADAFHLNGGASPHRNRIVNEMIMAGQRGEVSRVDQAFSRLASSGIPSEAEIAAKRAADAFSAYASKNVDAAISRKLRRLVEPADSRRGNRPVDRVPEPYGAHERTAHLLDRLHRPVHQAQLTRRRHGHQQRRRRTRPQGPLHLRSWSAHRRPRQAVRRTGRRELR